MHGVHEHAGETARHSPPFRPCSQDADGTLHVLDVVTNKGSGPDTVFVAVANPERTRNVLFVTRTDAVLRRTVASGARLATAGFGFVLPE
jgi:hypothetical protein